MEGGEGGSSVKMPLPAWPSDDGRRPPPPNTAKGNLDLEEETH